VFYRDIYHLGFVYFL